MNRERMKGFAVAAALIAAAWFSSLRVGAVTPATYAHAPETEFAASDDTDSHEARPQHGDGDDDVSLLREGLADGRYWAWIDGQVAMP